MEQRADLFCVFLILIFPSLWTRLENWFPSLRRFCLHTNRTKTSPPDVPQSRGINFLNTKSWSRSGGATGKSQKVSFESLSPVNSTPLLCPWTLEETTHSISQASGTRLDFSNPLVGITYVACPCNWCTAWNQRVREQESGRGGRRNFS